MTSQDLKNSILQLAMQGKLVPQDSHDEPASELLKRICADKEQLIKEGKIKKDRRTNALGVPQDYEIPFDIPETWKWVYLGSILNKLTDGTHRTPRYTTDGVKFVSVKDLSNGFLNLGNTKFITESEHKELFRRCDPVKGDMLLSKVGTTGVPAIIDTDEPFSLFVSVALLKYNHTCIDETFLYYLLQSPLVQLQAEENTRGVGNKNWVLDAIAKTVVVLPPLAEQQRIVAKIEELMPLVDEYGKAQERLSVLNAEFPDKLRKSILQQAIQGKLTERDPTDEPASELLKRIRAEKEQFIKEGNGRKEKQFPQIAEDELPFEIPNGWAVIRIGDVGIYKKGPFGSSLTKSMFVPKGADAVKVYEQKNAIQKDYKLGSYYIRRSYFEEKMRGFEVFPGDIIVSCAGTIGETYVLPEGIEQGIINQALMRMKIVPSVNIDYFLLYFDYVLKKSAQGSSKGSAIKNIPPFDVFKRMVLPLPPLAEQQRIVERVNELLALCDELR